MRRLPLAVLLLLFSFCLQPAAAQTAELTDESPLAYSRVIDVPGVGEWYYYAQNDPAWSQSYYEPQNLTRYRRFGGGGCGPTSLAIALSRQLTPEQMAGLLEHKNPSKDGFVYCDCSVNGYHCRGTHEYSTIETPQAFLENLPRVMASYATGNNDHYRKYRDETPGTSLLLFRAVAEAYGLDYVGSSKWEDAYQALQEGYSVITTVTKGIFTQSSHYLVIANVDEEYIHLLDPWMRTEYEFDTHDRLEVLEPGLIRAKTSDFNRLGLYGFYMIKNPNKPE